MKTKPRKKAPKRKENKRPSPSTANGVMVGGPGWTYVVRAGSKIVIEDGVGLILGTREERGATELAFLYRLPMTANGDEKSTVSEKPSVIAAYLRLYRWMVQYNKRLGRSAFTFAYPEGDGEGAHVRVDPDTGNLYPNLPTSVLGYPVRVYEKDYGECPTDHPDDLVFAEEKTP